MYSLRQVIQEANEKKQAIGHFNVSNLEMFKAVTEAGIEMNVPLIIGVSEAERQFIGIAEIVALVKAARHEGDKKIFLNADHTYSFEKVKEAIDAGFDSVIFDGAKLPLDENIAVTKKCVEYARGCKRDVIVEGELGYIGQSSKVLEALPQGVSLSPENLTTAEDAKRFVDQTAVDLFAPAVGNIHGMFKGGDPALDISRIENIKKAVGVPLVLHGASGNSDADVKASITAGISIVHISTELRVAFRNSLEQSLRENKEIAPYKFDGPVVDAVKKLVKEKILLMTNQ